MDGLAFALPVALVAHDVLQIFVALYVVGAYYLAGVVDHLFGQSYLAGYLNGERTSRLTYLQLEQSLHLMAVVEHRTIDHTLVAVGEMLQVLIVGGDDAIGSLYAKLLEHRFCYGTADLRFSTGSELVDENQGAVVGALHHVLHVRKMARIRTQVVLDALFVTDVYEDVLEYSRL